MIFFRSRKDMAESRARKVSRNVFYSVKAFMVNFLMGYVSRIIFLRILDVSYLGINGLFSNIIGILSLADLGIGTAIMYSLYKPIAENDEEMIGSLIAFFRKIYLAIAAFVLALGLAAAPFMSFLVRLENPMPGLTSYYILALLNTVMSYLFVYRTTLITADQKSYIISNYAIAVKVITFVVQAVVLVLTKNYFMYSLAALVVLFMGNLAQNHAAMKLYPYLRAKPAPLKKELRTKIFSDVKSLFLYRFCGIVQSNTDNILISVMVGTVFVGYYSNYTLLLGVFTALLNTVFQAVKASVGSLMAESGSASERKRVFDIMEFLCFCVVGFCAIICVVLFQDIIESSFGSQYQLPQSVVLALAANFYTSNIRQNIWAFRETSGIFSETKYITLVTASLNIVLSVVFGKAWGISGILWATVVSRMVWAWWREPMIMYRKLFDCGCAGYIATYIRRLVLLAAVCLASHVVCLFVAVGNIFARCAIKFFIVAVMTGTAFVLCFFRTPEFRYCREHILAPALKRMKHSGGRK